MNEKIRKIITLLPAAVGIFLIILINAKWPSQYHDFSNFLILITTLITLLFYRRIWLQTLEKLGKISFLIPLTLGTLIFIWIYKDIRNAASFGMIIFFIAALSSRHWWRMARDVEYMVEDREYRSIPWYKRNRARMRIESFAIDLIIMIIFGLSIIIFSYFS